MYPQMQLDLDVLAAAVDSAEARMTAFAHSTNRMSQAQWARTFQPVEHSQSGSLIFDDGDGLDCAVLDAAPDNFVWTLIDWDVYGPPPGRGIVAGRMLFGAMGYYVTKSPWTSAQQSLVVILD